MKKILFLSLLLIAAGLVSSESVYIGITTMSVKDSLAAADTVATTKRTDSDTSNVFDVKQYEKLGFVFSSIEDTNFVNDTVGVIWQYSIDQTLLWISIDTMYVGLTSDTTYGATYHELDTLPPMNYIRFITYHSDALESSANNVGLFTNTYITTSKVWVKGWK